MSDARARQAFATDRRTGGDLPAEVRAWWAGLVVPPPWMLLAGMPVLSLALWRATMLMLS